MDRLSRVLSQVPASEKEYKENIAKKFGVKKLSDLEGSYLFGAKELGKKVTKTLKENGIRVAGLIDNDKTLWGKTREGLLVASPDDLKGINDPRVIITSRYISEIRNQLTKLGIKNILPHYVLSYLYPKYFPNVIHQGSYKAIVSSKEKIKQSYLLLSDKESKDLFVKLIEFRLQLDIQHLPEISKAEEYFPGDFWKLSDDEIFVDVGAYNGDTLKSYLRHKKDFKEYIALEPDKKNFIDFKKSVPDKMKSKVRAICAGAGSDKKTVKFSGFGREDSLIDENGTEEIEIIKLDDLYSEQKKNFTTVKVDVEGYEPEVIRGMKKILRELKPKMALCVYHRPDHLWNLMLMLSSINPLYGKFYLRHHENELYGTVLYAF